MDTPFGGNNNGGGNYPGLAVDGGTLQVQTVTANEVQVTFASSDTISTADIVELALNVVPGVTLTSSDFSGFKINGSSVSDPFSTITIPGLADDAGQFGVTLVLSTAQAAGDSISFDITDASGLIPQDFIYGSQPESPTQDTDGFYYAGIDIHGTGALSSDYTWAGQPVPDAVSTAFLLLAALASLTGMLRSKRSPVAL